MTPSCDPRSSASSTAHYGHQMSVLTISCVLLVCTYAAQVPYPGHSDTTQQMSLDPNRASDSSSEKASDVPADETLSGHPNPNITNGADPASPKSGISTSGKTPDDHVAGDSAAGFVVDLGHKWFQSIKDSGEPGLESGGQVETATSTAAEDNSHDDDDDGSNNNKTGPFLFNSWFQKAANIRVPRADEKRECNDFCSMFRDRCGKDAKCVTNESCKMVCRNDDGSEVPLESKSTKAPARELPPLSERQCGGSDKLCVHGTCTNGQDCTCEPGYLGELCADKECETNCHHGVCRHNATTGHSFCACDPGWTEVFCHVRCTLECENNGTCMKVVGPEAGMVCNCPSQFIGERCEKRKPDPVLGSDKSSTFALIMGLATVVVFLLALTLSLYILWRKRVLFVFKFINMFKAYEDDGTDDKLYDAYVSLTDADYVFLKHVLQPKLEQMGHRLYLHARDSTAGEVKSEKILEAVEKSRRCIMLLSGNYISNEWCRFEYLIAQHETCIKLKQRIIPILLEDIDKDKKKMDKTLRFIVDHVRCLRYPVPPAELSDGQFSLVDFDCDQPKSKDLVAFEKHQARFWERMRLSMPKKREASDVTSPTLSCTSECPLTEHVHYNNGKGVRLFFRSLSNIFTFIGSSGPKSPTAPNFTLTSPSAGQTLSPTGEKPEQAPPVALVSAASMADGNKYFYHNILDRCLSMDGANSPVVGEEKENKHAETLKLEISL